MKKRTRISRLSASADFKKEMTGRVMPWDLQSVLQIRQDIKSWTNAKNQAQSDEPKLYPLQLLLTQISDDALLSSQRENRKQQLFTSNFALKNGDNIDEEQTLKLKKSAIYRQITNAILESDEFWYSVIELVQGKDKDLECILIPRTNIIPQTGTFYKNYLEDTAPIKYRELKEFSKWILEFTGDPLGRLNKVVPHVLMKRFAQSCWSELCEIYGIPPRVMKTNTRDQSMLNRAKTMMQQMGAASWFIIDNNESFDWAQGVNTKGEVYAELIRLCNNEISLAISGAIIGQDTVHGNRSKDESAQEVLWQLVKSDMQKVEQAWNKLVIPALVRLGWLNGNVEFEFEKAEDLEQLYKFTVGFMPYKDVPDDWIEEKFGVKVTTKSGTSNSDQNNNLSADFFV